MFVTQFISEAQSLKSNIERARPRRPYDMPHIFLLIQIPFGQIRGPQDRAHSRLELGRFLIDVNAQRGNSLHCTAKNSIPIPNF